MISVKKLILLIVTFMILYLIIFGVLIWLVLPRLDSPAIAGIIGAFGGALAGILGSATASVVGAWDRSREVNERLKDRVSSHALELTKMDYELRQKSFDTSKGKLIFLAPVKVYRELYRALLELHEKGTWPKSIEEIGLLNVFELGAGGAEKESPRGDETSFCGE